MSAIDPPEPQGTKLGPPPPTPTVSYGATDRAMLTAIYNANAPHHAMPAVPLLLPSRPWIGFLVNAAVLAAQVFVKDSSLSPTMKSLILDFIKVGQALIAALGV